MSVESRCMAQATRCWKPGDIDINQISWVSGSCYCRL